MAKNKLKEVLGKATTKEEEEVVNEVKEEVVLEVNNDEVVEETSTNEEETKEETSEKATTYILENEITGNTFDGEVEITPLSGYGVVIIREEDGTLVETVEMGFNMLFPDKEKPKVVVIASGQTLEAKGLEVEIKEI